MAEREAAHHTAGHQHRFAGVHHIVLARAGRAELLQWLRLDAERHFARCTASLDAQAADVAAGRSGTDGAVVDLRANAHAERGGGWLA